MKVRLVAYRKATSASTSESTYQLDLQEQPNVSLNFQFSDIKEPEKRKGSFSQTFKLPFTDNNNEFFQNWFNVNLETLVFNTRNKFNASLFVGAITQFDGIIQLKAVYQKAQLYEVVLMSNTADLFSVIGSSKLRDLFINNDGSPSRELNHTFNYENIGYSWDGTTTSFKDVFDVSLKDTVANVQKVTYPLSISVPKFWYEGDNNRYLAMSNIAAQGDNAAEYMVPINQLKPAIQLRTILELILAKAGFSLNSTFLNSTYFRKLYMTTCNHTGVPHPSVFTTAGAVTGQSTVGNDSSFKVYNFDATQDISCDNMVVSNYQPLSLTDDSSWILVPADRTTPTSGYSTPSDPYALWQVSTSSILRADTNINSVNVRFIVNYSNIQGCAPAGFEFGEWPFIEMQWQIRQIGGVQAGAVQTSLHATTGVSGTFECDQTLDISLFPPGTRVQIYCRPTKFRKNNNDNPALITLGCCDLPNMDVTVQIEASWIGLGDSIYDKEVDILNCIDASITQKAFLKDLIERFNLVVVPDPNSASGVIIEPYNDFIASGEIKHWTDKIDLSKEVIVKDTTSMQKSRIHLTDLEDVDLWNKSIKEDAPDLNVFGNVDIINTQNQFASGELKNSSIFSPYINEKVFSGNNENWPSVIKNMAVQYEYTYKRVGGGSYEDAYEATKPKLFFYNGTKTSVTSYVANYYLHSFSPSTGEVVSHQFNDYPLCSPYDLDASSGGSTITDTTKSLYWSQQPPPAGELLVFNSNPNLVIGQSLYYEYWRTYLNQIYDEDTRIMECHLNLNEVDIHNLNFGDEIFIKDSYWRILSVSNYQVGVVSSTKVTLIKIAEVFSETCAECDFVPVGATGSENNVNGGLILWCPADDPNCTPATGGQILGTATTPECCACFGDEANFSWIPQAGVGGTAYSDWTPGYGICWANGGSLPIQKKELYNRPRAVLSVGNLRTILDNKLNGMGKPLITGTHTSKFTKAILPYMGDDVQIKYKNTNLNKPYLNGESHRFILIGYTEGTSVGYAYINGEDTGPGINMPSSSIVNIRAKAIVTVVGGTSSTYTQGVTEVLTYAAGFRQIDGEVIERVGSRGGDLQYGLAESGKSVTCSLFITADNVPTIDFGLKDTQSDTKRMWQLEVNLDINLIPSMSLPYETTYANYQNSMIIQLQDGNYLLWN